jgi:hypothetical protein
VTYAAEETLGEEALDAMGRVVGAATPPGGSATFDGLLTATNDDPPGEDALDGLVRRVLLSMLEERRTRQSARA